MAEKELLIDYLIEALNVNGGNGKIVDICKIVWEKHEMDLRNMGDLFYSWQYDIRWAASELKKQGRLKHEKIGHKNIWILI